MVLPNLIIYQEEEEEEVVVVKLPIGTRPVIMLKNLLLSTFLVVVVVGALDFEFPAVFNFGDSNSDTGGLVSGLGKQLYPPNGEDYFGRPVGRYCDGRLIIDFLSK